jgi:energy-coupling factor transporter ATP-binding protein EcfA2
MLQSVQIENFRCLKQVSVPLRPLTVLIGPNDSGKSAFLAALNYLIMRRGFERTDYWRQDEQQAVSILGQSSAGAIRMTRNGPVVTPPLPDLRPASLIHLPSGGVRMEGGGHPDDQGPQPVGGEGEGVPGLLDYLLRRDRPRFFQVVETMRRLVPGLEDLEIATPRPENRRIEFVIERGLRIPAGQTSAGVRLLLFFVALAYHPQPPRTILLEEPETGIHPRRLADVMGLLREITRGDHAGHAAQVILTTHSPYLLDSVDLTTDQVLVFSRATDGSRTAEPADEARLQVFLDEFLLGEVWYNQGEQGLVAPRP